MTTLYEELFEGKHPRKCENCARFVLCVEEGLNDSDVDADTCDDYEEEGRSLYDDIYGNG